jgi:hypothetical protein
VKSLVELCEAVGESEEAEESEQHSSRQKLKKGDMSPPKRPQFSDFRAAKFLDTSCHRFVSTDLGFSPIKSQKILEIRSRKKYFVSRSFSMTG